jgi:hypothetical protein
MMKYLMRLRLHVSVLVPLSDPRAKAKASERLGKARHLLYRVSEIDVAARRNQLLHRVRVPFIRGAVDRRFSILGRGSVGWCGVVVEASGCGGYIYYIYIYT